jgi:hypothetical protein
MFKKRRGIKLSYAEQGLIHFLCLNADKLGIGIRIRILCIDIAREDWPALFEVLTNDNVAVYGIAMKYYTNDRKLYTCRKKFYEVFAKEVFKEQ